MKNKDGFSLSAMRWIVPGIDSISGSLDNNGLIAEALYQRGLIARTELNPVPKPGDHPLSLSKYQTIAVVTPRFFRASQFEHLRGVMSVAAASNYEVRLFSVETISQRHKTLQKALRRARLGGLLIFFIVPTEADVHCIRQVNLPTVLVEARHPEISSIVIDGVAATQTAVQYLIELGHHKIAYLSEYLDDPLDLSDRHQRYQGYCQTLEAAGLPLNPAYHCQRLYRHQQSRQMILDLLGLPDPPTAIFAANDELALGVLEAARELNLEIPRDLSVMGFDNGEVAQFARLTTGGRHLFELGVQGAKRLLEAIDQPDRPPTQMQLATELVIRHSTAPPGR